MAIHPERTEDPARDGLTAEAREGGCLATIRARSASGALSPRLLTAEQAAENPRDRADKVEASRRLDRLARLGAGSDCWRRPSFHAAVTPAALVEGASSPLDLGRDAIALHGGSAGRTQNVCPLVCSRERHPFEGPLHRVRSWRALLDEHLGGRAGGKSILPGADRLGDLLDLFERLPAGANSRLQPLQLGRFALAHPLQL